MIKLHSSKIRVNGLFMQFLDNLYVILLKIPNFPIDCSDENSFIQETLEGRYLESFNPTNSKNRGLPTLSIIAIYSNEKTRN